MDPPQTFPRQRSPLFSQRTDNSRTKPKNNPCPTVAFLLFLLLPLSFIMISHVQLLEQSDHNISGIYSIQAAPPVDSKRAEDTAIIITSSPVPSLPSTYMVEMVINSTKRIRGLSPTAPIFVTIDIFHQNKLRGLTDAEFKEHSMKLEQYSINLYNLYLRNTNVHVIPNMRHNHIGGSTMKAMNLIEQHYPTVKYLYYLQHDFYFAKDVDHNALVSAMIEHPTLNWVRFMKNKRPKKGCADMQEIKLKGQGAISLAPTSGYTDNNHLTRLQWYKEVIKSLENLERAPEGPLQNRAWAFCDNSNATDVIGGLYVYSEADVIAHLDGRHTLEFDS